MHQAQINDRWDREYIMRRARHRLIATATATENGIVAAEGRAGGHAVVASGDSVCLLFRCDVFALTGHVVFVLGDDIISLAVATAIYRMISYEKVTLYPVHRQ